MFYADDTAIEPDVLTTLRNGAADGAWYAYQNVALDSSTLGEIRFLKVGPKATFTTPPKRYPDSHLGTGWRHYLCGVVNLETGKVEEI